MKLYTKKKKQSQIEQKLSQRRKVGAIRVVELTDTHYYT